MKKLIVAVAVPATALALVACGSSGDKKVTAKDIESAITSGLPACSDVWVVGKTVDLAKYQGCKDGDTLVAAATAEWGTAPNICRILTNKDSTMWVQQWKDGPSVVTDEEPICTDNGPQ